MCFMYYVNHNINEGNISVNTVANKCMLCLVSFEQKKLGGKREGG